MKCPSCGSASVPVKDSRQYYANTIRKRSCANCGNTFYTKEIVIDYNDGYENIAEYHRNYNHCRSRKKEEKK